MAKEKNDKEEVKKEFINPIDKDKIAENPGLLPYAHTVGGSVIKPIDEGRVKGNALAAMEQQTDMQMAQLYKQMELLAKQAEAIKKRKEVSESIYLAKMSFEPKIGHVYFLYEKKDGESVVSLVAPNQWGRRGMPFAIFIAKIRLLADHTWDIIEG
ncbi:MAG: DUF2452 domain-containing protein [Saprospiraceae bacterium]